MLKINHDVIWARLAKMNVKCDVDTSTQKNFTEHGFSMKRTPDSFHFEKSGKLVKVPFVSPHTGKELEYIYLGILNTIVVLYGTTYNEEEVMACGASVLLLTPEGLSTLPHVLPDTWVFMDEQILIIRRVEKSPFGVPCAAKYDPAEVHVHACIEDGYIFPSEEPIIIEGRSVLSETSSRIHGSDITGFDIQVQDPTLIYPWISPDNKRHGWAASLPSSWEVHGKTRPYPDSVIRKEPEGILTVVPTEPLDRAQKMIEAVIKDRELYGWYDRMDEHKFAPANKYIVWKHITEPDWCSVYAQNFKRRITALKRARYSELGIKVPQVMEEELV